MTETEHVSNPQRQRALQQANAVRFARAKLKQQITRGEVSAAEIILDCPEVARRWTLSELLTAQRRWGTTRCRKFLERNHIGEMKPIGDLTDRQRKLLAEQLHSSAALTAVSVTGGEHDLLRARGRELVPA